VSWTVLNYLVRVQRVARRYDSYIFYDAPPMTTRRPHLRIAPAALTDDAARRPVLADCAEGKRQLQRYGLSGLRTALSVAGAAETASGWSHFGAATRFSSRTSHSHAPNGWRQRSASPTQATLQGSILQRAG
jgi:hypothetical protein